MQFPKENPRMKANTLKEQAIARGPAKSVKRKARHKKEETGESRYEDE